MGEFDWRWTPQNAANVDRLAIIEAANREAANRDDEANGRAEAVREIIRQHPGDAINAAMCRNQYDVNVNMPMNFNKQQQ